MSKQKGKFRFKTLTAQELANQHLNGSPDLRKRENEHQYPKEEEIAIEAIQGAINVCNYNSKSDANTRWCQSSPHLQCHVCDRKSSMEDYTPKYYNPNEKYDIDRDSHSHGPIEYGFVYWPTGVAICLGCLHGTVEFITPGANGAVKLSTRIIENNQTRDWSINKHALTTFRAKELIEKHKEKMKTNFRLKPINEEVVHEMLYDRADVYEPAQYVDERGYPKWNARLTPNLDHVPDYEPIAMHYVPTDERVMYKRKSYRSMLTVERERKRAKARNEANENHNNNMRNNPPQESKPKFVKCLQP
jgi:hypothetical protein